MGKNILGKRIIVCAKLTLRKRCVNETIIHVKFYSLNIIIVYSRLPHVVHLLFLLYTVKKMKFSIKDFFGKRDQIHSFQRI